jgi:type IV pilus assembly protein PilQ
MSLFRYSIVSSVAFSFLLAVPLQQLHAQGPQSELRDELDALDDLPPDDLNSAQPKAPAPQPGGQNAENAVPEPIPEPAPQPAPTPPQQQPVQNAKGDDALDDLPVEEATPEKASPEQALTGVNTEMAGQVESIDFKQLRDRVRLVIKGNKVLDYARDSRKKRKQLVLELRNMTIAKKVLKRAMDTGEFDGPVALVQAFDSQSGSLPAVKVLLQLRQNVNPTITRSGNDLYIDFPTDTGGSIFKDRAANSVVLPETFLSPQDKMTFTGSRISLNVKDAPLNDIINLISKASGRNFVILSGNTSKVTLNIQNTPWDQVLTIVLVNAGMGYQKMGDIYRIAPTATIASEIQLAAKAQEDQLKLIPQETRLITLSYAKASEVSIDGFLTSGSGSAKAGKKVIDARTNSIAITDYPEALEKIERYIKLVDLQSPQVLIEGRIVEAKQTFLRNFNLNWTSIGVASSRNTNKLYGSFVNSGADAGNKANANGSSITTPTAASSALGVGLRLALLGDFGTVAAAIGLDEKEHKGKIIANPKVLVQNTKTAKISQGSTTFTTTPAGVSGAGDLKAVTANTELTVTPQVSSDGFVYLEINLKRDTPTGEGSNQDTRSIDTKLLVESGKTVVLGGLYTDDQNTDVVGWPVLKNLPVLGLLFQNSNSKKHDITELLMFISPKIINEDRAVISNFADEKKDKLSVKEADAPSENSGTSVSF